MSTDVANQTTAVTLPAHRPSAEAWGERLKTDAYYADPNVFDVEVEAAEYSHPGYVSLRFSVEDAIVKIVSAARQGRDGRRRPAGAADRARQSRQAQRLHRRVRRTSPGRACSCARAGPP